MKILVLNGPNLNLLGNREPDVYGTLTLAELETRCREWGEAAGAVIECRQSNGEGDLVGWIQAAAADGSDGVVLNAGGYTHTSVALRDAVAAVSVPVVEVHLSNTQARESFRHVSMVAPVCVGTIQGFGADGYRAAIEILSRR